MEEKIKEIAKKGLVGLVALIYLSPMPPPKNWVVAQTTDSVFKKYIIDEDKNGEADTTFTILIGSRIPYREVRDATQEEKNFYAQHKRN